MNNMKNQEGYMDTTAHQAIKRMEQPERPAFRPLVYICAPFIGNREANVNQAIAFAKHACGSEYIPLTPHWSAGVFNCNGNVNKSDIRL